jgi:leucyl aminopeptidase
MVTRLVSRRAPLVTPPARSSHILVVTAPDDPWPDAPGRDAVRRAKARTAAVDSTPSADAAPVTVQLERGQLVSWVASDPAAGAFERHSKIRKAMAPLLAEHPKTLDIAVYGDEGVRAVAAGDAVYVALVNATPLAAWKRGPRPQALETVTLHGSHAGSAFGRTAAIAEGNLLCRELTSAPANMLTPTIYRTQLAELARQEGWRRREFGLERLQRMGAGAFAAVARGSHQADAAIVHLTYDGRPTARSGSPRAGRSVALVGKGICFDTGGHNLKKDTSMNEMHHDMNGSAVAVGTLLAATRLRLPIKIDVWLAIAQNHLSPSAYTQNEVVTALDGTTIETTHTDAEGRMVLADTLVLAAREAPDEIIDFATLTGSMWVALGSRMSGVISNRDELAARAVAAGLEMGERVVSFPMPADYDEALESTVADVKQCVLESGAADHVLAARFLQRFVDDRPWLHVDLSAVSNKGGLGAVATDVTGFGVALALRLLES